MRSSGLHRKRILGAMGVRSSQAQNPEETPSRVTDGGVYQHFVVLDPDWGVEWYPSDEEIGQFSISINPDQNSPQAVIHVDGPVLREVWGGPLIIEDDFDSTLYTQMVFVENDPKPGQIFAFIKAHADYGLVRVWVFAHDTPWLQRGRCELVRLVWDLDRAAAGG